MVVESRIGPRPERVDIDPDRGYQIRYNRHPNKKNNFKVAEMYDCYKDGMSLAVIGKLYGKTRQAVYDVFRSRGYKLRKKRLRGLTMLDGIQFTLMKGGYLRGTVPGKGRMLMHHYVWEKANGPIPDDCVIYFLDGDSRRCELGNLGMITKREMQKVFNPEGKNQYSKPNKDGDNSMAPGEIAL